MPLPSRIRLLLLGNSDADAESATAALARAGMDVGIRRTSTRREFEESLLSFAPDVVVCGHPLAGFDWSAAVELLRERRPAVPLVVLTDGMGEHDIVACIHAGAEDVLLREHASRLPDVIQAALDSRRELSRLSPRQLEVLRLIALGKPSREIARQLQVSVKTVETHRMAIMKRLGRHDIAGLVRLAVRCGMVATRP